MHRLLTNRNLYVSAFLHFFVFPVSPKNENNLTCDKKKISDLMFFSFNFEYFILLLSYNSGNFCFSIHCFRKLFLTLYRKFFFQTFTICYQEFLFFSKWSCWNFELSRAVKQHQNTYRTDRSCLVSFCSMVESTIIRLFRFAKTHLLRKAHK